MTPLTTSIGVSDLHLAQYQPPVSQSYNPQSGSSSIPASGPIYDIYAQDSSSTHADSNAPTSNFSGAKHDSLDEPTDPYAHQPSASAYAYPVPSLHGSQGHYSEMQARPSEPLAPQSSYIPLLPPQDSGVHKMAVLMARPLHELYDCWFGHRKWPSFVLIARAIKTLVLAVFRWHFVDRLVVYHFDISTQGYGFFEGSGSSFKCSPPHEFQRLNPYLFKNSLLLHHKGEGPRISLNNLNKKFLAPSFDREETVAINFQLENLQVISAKSVNQFFTALYGTCGDANPRWNSVYQIIRQMNPSADFEVTTSAIHPKMFYIMQEMNKLSDEQRTYFKRVIAPDVFEYPPLPILPLVGDAST